MPSTSTSMTAVRPVRINSFCKHSLSIDGQNTNHLLVSLSWFRCHPRNSDFGKPITVWYYDLFESFGIHSLIPVQCLQSKSVSLISKLEQESFLFVSMH